MKEGEQGEIAMRICIMHRKCSMLRWSFENLPPILKEICNTTLVMEKLQEIPCYDNITFSSLLSKSSWQTPSLKLLPIEDCIEGNIPNYMDFFKI
jgi:hypothetical protein